VKTVALAPLEASSLSAEPKTGGNDQSKGVRPMSSEWFVMTSATATSAAMDLC